MARPFKDYDDNAESPAGRSAPMRAVPGLTWRLVLVRVAVALGLLYARAPREPRPQPPVLGVNAHLLWQDVNAAEVDRQLDAAVRARARMVRIDVGWASVEEKGKGRWSRWYLRRLDEVVHEARARGLQLLPAFLGTPCWASTAPPSLRQGCSGDWSARGVQYYAPADPEDYGDALAFLVRRYGRGVPAWEIWNEPNSPRFFIADDAARAYAALVKAAYRSVNKVDAEVRVVAGSLMHADSAFTKRLYDLGIEGSFDAFSIHPYSEDRSPLYPGSDRFRHLSFARGVPAVHDVMARHGDSRPLWLTEFGWNTSSTRGADAWRNGVDEDAQADYVGQALELVRTWWYVEVALVYELQDMGTDRGTPLENFGLLRHDRTRKPAFEAFRTAAARESPEG
jgi:polysaccharide biosynthesis protein PslG